jgi:hypothetical protein
MSMMTTMRMGLMALMLAATGCGGPSKCVPGATEACACTNGNSGAQICESTGTWAVCECDGTGPGDGDSGNGNNSHDMGSSSGVKRVFVTKLTYSTATARTVCQNVAEAAGLGGTWVAWLSMVRDVVIEGDAIDRVTARGPWKLITGETAFANHGQLATTPSLPIDVTEDGTRLPADALVWTGTVQGGTSSSSYCQLWESTSAQNNGLTGSVSSTSGWTDGGGLVPCNNQEHVYCFEN